jgi:hypothetical protein
VLRLDDIIDTVQVGAKATRSSFAQIKTLRDRVADLAYDDTLDRESRNRAVQFLASFDDLIVNGVIKVRKISQMPQKYEKIFQSLPYLI